MPKEEEKMPKEEEKMLKEEEKMLKEEEKAGVKEEEKAGAKTVTFEAVKDEMPFIGVMYEASVNGKIFRRKAWPKNKTLQARMGRIMTKENGRWSFISDSSGDMTAKDWEEVLPIKKRYNDSTKNNIKTISN